MRAGAIVQHADGTPTGPRSASFFIHGILGPDAWSIFMRWLRRLAERFSVAASLVWHEEWDDPLISGIGWVSELIEIAGGEDLFPELRKQKAAKDRIVSPDDVIAAAPDVIVASWF